MESWKRKADLFTKRTIRPQRQVTSVDTPSEALAVSLGERGGIDLSFMAELLGTPGEYTRITQELSGIIFCDPREAREDDPPPAGTRRTTTSPAMSGRKCGLPSRQLSRTPPMPSMWRRLLPPSPEIWTPRKLKARLGATWIEPEDIQKFMVETFDTPYYMRRRHPGAVFRRLRRVADHRKVHAQPETTWPPT